jgi:hypothetical protein
MARQIVMDHTGDTRHRFDPGDAGANGKALGAIPVDARRDAYAGFGEALRRPFGLAPVIIRHVKHSG